MLAEFMPVLMEASRFRDTFEAPNQSDLAAPVRLSAGDEPLELICVPSVLAASGPHEYVRFAWTFRGSRRVSALPIPGFREGERLPATIDAAAQALARSVQERSGEHPFVLVGHSSGGLLAHALAHRLHLDGLPPAGIVLIDARVPAGEVPVGALRALMNATLERADRYMSVSDVRLTAMGAYLRLLGGWQPPESHAPTLLVRASESISGMSAEQSWGSPWELAHSSADVPGDHFTMMENHADSTAQAVLDWLTRTVDKKKVS